MTPLGLRPAFTPLQAADFLAYEMFIASKNIEASDNYRLRWAIDEFGQIPGEPGIYESEDLAALEERLRVLRESDL